MKAELLKLRLLPTPRVLAAFCFGSVALVALIALLTQPDDPVTYRDAPAGMAWVAAMVTAIVLGAWVVGLEFAQGTMRRVLIAEPRRGAILLSKTAALVAAIALLAAGSALLALALGKLTASASGAGYDAGEALRFVPTIAVQAILVSLLVAALTLLFRSFTGGLIAGFVMLFVIETVLQISPTIADHSFVSALSEIDFTTGGDEAGDRGMAGALLLAFGWIAAFAAPGVARFLRGDFK